VGKREKHRFPKPVRRKNLQQQAADDAIEIMESIKRAQELYAAGDWDGAEVKIRGFMRKRKELVQPLSYDALGSCAQGQGRMDVALECYRKALEIDPDYIEARNRTIMILDAQPATTPERAQREREKWWARHGAHLYAKRKPHTNNRDPERPLRVGYVSGDFQYHSAATVFHRVVHAHTDAFVPFFYSNTPHEKWDYITKTYLDHPGWRDVVGWPDALLQGKIRVDEIDILVDLSAYTAHNRLQTFCYKPAPVQITGWGYATGVGWEAMDYLITDRVVVPEDRQHEHVEKMMYLPSIIDYEPTRGLPEPNPLPCLTGPPTFGVLQRPLKIHADDLEVWRQVLERLPESRLLMKGDYCGSFIQWMKDRFQDQVHQVEILGKTSSFEHKCTYQRVDLNLDPWPQTAGVSACDALWMGVPAVTLIGPRVIQRTTASFLTTLGLTDFIAETPDQYVDKAVEWVTTRKHELAEIRQGLPAKCDASPIKTGYVEAVEVAYRQAWRAWCASPMSLAEAQARLKEADAEVAYA